MTTRDEALFFSAKIRHVSRWVNRHIWRKVPFADYQASFKAPRPRDAPLLDAA